MKLNVINTFMGVLLVGGGLFALTGRTYAWEQCEKQYGGGEICIVNKSFRIEKKVRKEGDDSWKDKITGVDEDEVIEFKIKIKNTGEADVDDMKMEDFLPDELKRVGGSGLTEYWHDFDSDDEKSFIIKAEIDKDEFDRDEDFEKCVVNKAEVRFDGEFEGSDTATVCYGADKDDVVDLPDTGVSTMPMAFLGLGLVAAGTFIKKRLK